MKNKVEQIRVNYRVIEIYESRIDLKEVLQGRLHKKILKKEYTDLPTYVDYPFENKLRLDIPHAKYVADILVPVAKVIKESYDKGTKALKPFEKLVFELIHVHENGTCEVVITAN